MGAARPAQYAIEDGNLQIALDVSTYRFALLPWLPHDIISTDAVGANTELTYPVLLEQVDEHF